ncbi:hypothetical protein M8J76_004124 [Diaphorina citri]|nr:hypothetical protein M8J76_004124 [Diaphorina citri]
MGAGYTQPCETPVDFRAEQCAQYNGQLYNGQAAIWAPHIEAENPCALTCITQNGDIVTLNSRVQDGTRCTGASLDMCINGLCQKVGCDLRIGSDLTVDSCGVCGGDDTTCSGAGPAYYYWSVVQAAACSRPCGGGVRRPELKCRNRVTEEEVKHELCKVETKPRVVDEACNTQPCVARWVAEPWGLCSVPCGKGIRSRKYYCAQDIDGVQTRVSHHHCTKQHKPKTQEPCFIQACPPKWITQKWSPSPPKTQEPCFIQACPPKWITQKWSPCSAQCGEGIQMRNVSCNEGRPDVDCAHLEKPADVRTCSSDVQCDWNGRTLELEYRFHNYSTAEKLVGKLSPSDPTWSPDEWSDCSAPCGPGVRRRKVKCKIFLEFSKTFATLPDGECRGARPVIEEKCMVEPCVAKNRWVTEPWSNCSVPCGEGFKTRSVLCKTYLENARVLATVPDSQCEEVKPVDRQRCVMPLCALEHKLEAAAFQDEEIKVVSGSKGAFTYSWRSDDYTQCSKSCLQGVQETIVMCIRDQDSRSVHPGLCDPKTKPEVLYRTCNDFSCPPRWQTGEFQPCSKKCGLGIQLREVQCIHEVVRNSTSVVPNIQCPQPPPPDRQYCAVCSRPCGGGIKTRKVECKQEMAQRHIVNRLPEQCPKHRPVDKRPCNTKPCASEISRPFIDQWINGPVILTRAPRKYPGPLLVKVHLKVGNHATVYYNTQLKIKCPVHQFDRSKIKWIKDGQTIRRGKNYKISKKGALKIVRVTFQDDGVFTCKAGQSGADITIAVKPKSGVFINSEELPHGDGSPADPALIEPGKSPLRYDPEDSHEKNPTGVRKSTPAPYQERKRKPSVVGRGTTTPTPAQDWDNRTNGHNASSDTPEGPAKSGAARLLPTFRSLLSHLQTLLPFQVYAGVRGHDAHLTDDNKPDAAWHEPARPSERDDVNAARKMSGEELRHDEKGGEVTRDQETKRQETNGREIIPETSGREIKHETSGQEIKFREIIGQESSRETSGKEIKGQEIIGQESSRKTSGQELSWIGQNPNERSEENDSRMSSSKNDLKNDPTNDALTKNPSINNYATNADFTKNLSINNSATKDSSKKESIKHGFAQNGGKHERKMKKSAKNGTRTGVKRHRNRTKDDDLRGQGHQRRQGHQNLTSNAKDPIFGGLLSSLDLNPNTKDIRHVDNIVEENQDGGIKNGGKTQDGGSIHHFPNGDGSHDDNQDGGDVHLLDSEDGILPLPLFPLALAQTDQRFGSDDEEMGEEFILGKGSRQNLKFEWAVTDWSKCSQPCGGNGYRMRAAHCMAVLHNRTRNVDAALCIDAGLTAVPVIEACGARYCPVWKTGLWEACDAAQCFTWNTAMQTRTIWCEAENGTHLNGSYCEHDITPVTRQECYNDLCKGVWRVGEWSDCSAPCEGDGMKYRILQCVWYGTRRPAGNACRDQTRPSVMKICRGGPCTANNAKCEDRSRYCRNVRKMNLCKLERYQKECCSSCKQSTL